MVRLLTGHCDHTQFGFYLGAGALVAAPANPLSMHVVCLCSCVFVRYSVVFIFFMVKLDLKGSIDHGFGQGAFLVAPLGPGLDPPRPGLGGTAGGAVPCVAGVAHSCCPDAGLHLGIG